MSAVGSLLFCGPCGNLLDRIPGHDSVRCEHCHAVNKDIAATVITTRTKPNAFPSALRLRHSAVQKLGEDELNTEAKIGQTCPECGRREMWFHTQQLRGADEGATVFYRCECGHRFNTNN